MKGELEEPVSDGIKTESEHGTCADDDDTPVDIYADLLADWAASAPLEGTIGREEL